MTAAELAECWVPVPMRSRHVKPGDVIVGKDGTLWPVVEIRGSALDILAPHVGVRTYTVDPDEVATVLLPAALRDAMELSRDELGAKLLERRGA